MALSSGHAAARRSTDRSRLGFLRRGPSSKARSASRTSSMETGAFRPSGALSDGQDVIADASEAHDARMARFSERLRVGWETTSFGCSNALPGRSEEHTSELQSQFHLVCRLLLEKQ